MHRKAQAPETGEQQKAPAPKRKKTAETAFTGKSAAALQVLFNRLHVVMEEAAAQGRSVQA